MTVKQMPFEWLDEDELAQPVEVVLDAETTEVVVTLMARAMIAAVRAVEEVADER